MNQEKTIKIIRDCLKSLGIKYRLIKIHGDKYQEAGLPDVMILISNKQTHYHLWFEIKCSWRDQPTKLQDYNIHDLRQRGWVTGYVVGDEFKENFNDEKSIGLKDFFYSICDTPRGKPRGFCLVF